MFRKAFVLSLATSSVAFAQTPDPKPLAVRVELLEARVRRLESLSTPVPTVAAATVTVTESTAPVCANGRCSTRSTRRLFGR